MILTIIYIDAEQVELARTAWRLYGRGNHPGGLNIGDCCAYALAKYSGEHLLFNGGDFALTDIASALPVYMEVTMVADDYRNE